MREGCLVKLGLDLGEEKRFFAQFSLEVRYSSTLLVVASGQPDAETSDSGRDIIAYYWLCV